jgi:mannitol/fructose-specific phosphotransferase system IIA component (Ntr-type)
VTSGRCTDIETFLADVREREEKMATGLPGGIGIPHARSEAITEPSLVFGRSPTASTGAPRTARRPSSSSSRRPRRR